jgi:hypothetical protein
MGFFKRQPQPTQRRDVARLLAEWGQARYNGDLSVGTISAEAEQFRDEIMSMGFHQDATFETRRTAAIQEIRDAALREGGWAAYGAWEAVDMMHVQFQGLDPPEDVMQELVEARVRFLRTMNDPQLAKHLNTWDIFAFLKYFPEDHARLFPNWDKT